MSARTVIMPTCLDDPAHADALILLLDHYASSPMGGGKPLGNEARQHLVPRLRQCTGYCGFIAFVDDDPAGLINCFEGFSTFAARALLNVHDLAVHQNYRRQGIGRKLLDAAEQAARLRACCKLTLEVLSSNHHAQALYKQSGYHPYSLDPLFGQALFMQKTL